MGYQPKFLRLELGEMNASKGSRPLTKVVGRAVRGVQRRCHRTLAYLRGPKTLAGSRPLLLIGGLGGSGTRVVAELAHRAGYFIGTDLNHALDSIDVAAPTRRWLPHYLKQAGRPVSGAAIAAMRSDFERSFVRHRSAIPAAGAPWAVKYPKTVQLLGWLCEAFPDMSYIHVVRDGRDIAFAANTDQFELFEQYSQADDHFEDEMPVRIAAFWASSVVTAENVGCKYLGNRYLRIRLEDLCSDPLTVTRRMFDWLAADETDVKAAAAQVHTPGSLRRWQRQETKLVAAIEAAISPALQQFGYLDTAPSER